MKRPPLSYRPLRHPDIEAAIAAAKVLRWRKRFVYPLLKQAPYPIKKEKEVPYALKGLVGKSESTTTHAVKTSDSRWVQLQAWITYQIQVRQLSPVMANQYKAFCVIFYRFLEKHNLMVGQVKPSHVQQWADLMLEQRYTTKTIRERIWRAHNFYEWLIINDKFEKANPIRQPILPRHQPKQKLIMTLNQYNRLTKYCAGKDPWDYLSVIGWETGLRLGDACLLRWDQINFEGKYLAITPSKTKTYGTKVILPLNTALIDLFNMMRARQAKRGVKSPFVSDHLGVEFERAGSHVIGTQFKARCRGAGIRGITYSCFRHGFVSRLLERGVPPQVVMSMSGHTNLDTVFKYTHISLDAKRKALEQGSGGTVTWDNNDALHEYLKP